MLGAACALCSVILTPHREVHFGAWSFFCCYSHVVLKLGQNAPQGYFIRKIVNKNSYFWMAFILFIFSSNLWVLGNKEYFRTGLPNNVATSHIGNFHFNFTEQKWNKMRHSVFQSPCVTFQELHSHVSSSYKKTVQSEHFHHLRQFC